MNDNVLHQRVSPLIHNEYKDLAPMIHRQRMVIEGYPESSISAEEIKTYLRQLSGILDMKVLCEPVTHQSPKYGWAGWIHWETSGAHFYAWDEPLLFFSVDIYTCKEFSEQRALDYTGAFFNASELSSRQF